MKVLVACEESQAVTIEFRKLGIQAYSCDIIDCSGGHPEWHIKQDVLPLLDGNCEFKTMDGKIHNVSDKWDMIIAFPPCTHLCVTGSRWFTEGKKPISLQYEARDFFMNFVNADCPKIAIENPVGRMSTYFRKPNQIINPWQFGHTTNKKTCLWLKGLPLLEPTKIIPKELEPKLVGGVGDINFGKQYRQGNRVIYTYNESCESLDLDKPFEIISVKLKTREIGAVLQNGIVWYIRKLIPLECWRLMGFADSDFEKAKSAGVSNSQLYKQAGNSIVVPVLEAIFRNLF